MLDQNTNKMKITPNTRQDYRWFTPITTRWLDNDVYGHINNVIYYAFFDTAVNQYLLSKGVLDIHAGHQIGLVIESGCSYFAPLSYPQVIDAGIRVAKIGNTSVRYEIGLFAAGSASAAAQGYFVHVYVDKKTRRPETLTPDFRGEISNLLVLN
jgi:acyl-CoA thioester hydrolase